MRTFQINGFTLPCNSVVHVLVSMFGQLFYKLLSGILTFRSLRTLLLFKKHGDVIWVLVDLISNLILHFQV